MTHPSSPKVLCAAVLSTLLAATIGGCSSSGAGTHSLESRRLGSRGATAVIPAGWHQVPLRHLPGATVALQVASFSADGAVRTICNPQSVVRQIPAGGVLLQILEDSEPNDYEVQPKPFRLGPRRSYECGEAYNVVFRKRGQVFQLRIWTAPGGMSKEVRRQVEALMTSFMR